MRFLFLLSTLLLFSPLTYAQFGLNENDFALGAGFVFAGEEELVFDDQNIYGALHWNGFTLPGPSVSTGVGVEFHPTTVHVGEEAVTLDYRIWSLNRFDCPAALYCGADMKVGEGGDGGFQEDFDVRGVTGIRIARYGPTLINFELYVLEDDRPVSALILVRWGGANQPD